MSYEIYEDFSIKFLAIHLFGDLYSHVNMFLTIGRWIMIIGASINLVDI